MERLKARQLQQERVEEMRKLRDAYETDRKLELVALQNRLEEEKKKEVDLGHLVYVYVYVCVYMYVYESGSFKMS